MAKDKSKKKKSKSAGTGKGFNFQEFLLFHVEKLIFGLIALLSLALVYLGVSGQKFPTSQTPDDLQKKAEQAMNSAVREDHWEQMVSADPDRTVKVSYFKVAQETRGEVEAGTYLARIWREADGESVKRGDPALRAPIRLRGYYFTGAIGELASKDVLEDYENAEKPEEKPTTPRGRNRRQNQMNMGMDMYDPTMMDSSMAGGPGGPGAGVGMAGPAALIRRLNPAYDKGFRPGMSTLGGGGMYGSLYGDPTGGMGADPYGGGGMPGGGMAAGGPGLSGGPPGPGGRRRQVMAAKGFETMVVTAIVEHRELENNYAAEFRDVPGFMQGRDNPYYQGFEVQRVEIKANTKEIAEEDWVTIQAASPEAWKEHAKTYMGTCDEPSNPTWTTPNLSMPIPPFLIADYAQFCRHPDVPSKIPDPVSEDEVPTNAGGDLYGAGGMDPYGGAGMDPYGGAGMGIDPYGGAGMVDSYSDPAGGGGYGGDMYGGGMSMGMGGPQRLPSTKYKLIRFFDNTVTKGASYRYRVRVLMYDPNFPEYEAMAPKSIQLKPEALSRVQDLRQSIQPDSRTQKRLSARPSDWSAPSDVLVAITPTPVYAGEFDSKAVAYTRVQGTGEFVPSKNPKWNMVILNRIGFVGFPLHEKEAVGRGHVFYGNDRPNKEGVEFVNPASKLIKIPKEKRKTPRPPIATPPTIVVSVVDVGGGVPLASASNRDDLRTGGEIVSFDASTGQLVVSREFDDYTNFNRIAKPDENAVGPLGGALTGGSGMSGDMYGGEMGMGGYPGMP